MAFIDYNKYEKYIRVGHTATRNPNGTYNCTDLEDFPTPSTLGRTLHDVDVDAYTDLQGYTQRNRVRHDVEDIEISYSVVSDDDIAYILNRISPAWIYVELTDKKTKERVVHKMYASDKSFNVYRVVPNYVRDDQNFVEYTDGENNFYWYDEESQTLYDSEYVVSSVNIATLSKVEDGTYSEQDTEFGFSLVEQ